MEPISTLQDAIIFDFNGVLLWDNPIHEQVWAEFAASLRGAPLTADETATHMHGRTNQDILEYILGRALAAHEVARLADQKETIYRARAMALGAAYQLSPGAVNLLDFLVQRRIPHAIATASGKDNVDFFIQRLELARWFDLEHIIYDDGRLPGKPPPHIYQQAPQPLGLPPQNREVVDENISGLQSAHAAGIGCIIAIAPPERHAALRQTPGVSLVITTLADLPRRLFSPTP